ncbi:MAG: hypothetical protein ABR865_04125 [Terracidiphilus sp.]
MNSGAVAKAIPRRSFEASQLPVRPDPDLVASARRAPTPAPAPAGDELVAALAAEIIEALLEYRPIVCTQYAAQFPRSIRPQSRPVAAVFFWPRPVLPPLFRQTLRAVMLEAELELTEAANGRSEARRTLALDQQMLPFTESEYVEVLRARGHLTPQEDLAAKVGAVWP